MKVTLKANREDVYNAPIIQQNSDTYTPVSNKLIMDLIEDKLRDNGLVVQSEEYRVARNNVGAIKGIIGSYNITTDDAEYGQKVMFRNSYDKSMSFAIVCGMQVWICSNGCISGEYQYRRIHKGIIRDDNSSTTIDDVQDYIIGGIGALQNSFEHTAEQLNELKHFDVSPKEAYDIVGQLFFEIKAISITQMSIIQKEFENSRNFNHLGESNFTAFDLYNHITESLKTSHPLTYVKDHVDTHNLFEKVFSI